MFRLLRDRLQDNCSLIAAGNVVNDNYQCGLMAPTDILAKQHYETAQIYLKTSTLKLVI